MDELPLLQSHPRWPAIRRQAHDTLDARLNHLETLFELVQRTRGIRRLWRLWRLERLLHKVT